MGVFDCLCAFLRLGSSLGISGIRLVKGGFLADAAARCGPREPLRMETHLDRTTSYSVFQQAWVLRGSFPTIVGQRSAAQ